MKRRKGTGRERERKGKKRKENTEIGWES